MAIGWTEVILILIVILILFGPKRLPELARSIGKAVRAYKMGVNEPEETKKSSKKLKG
jgi:sec-independent protein translocase protein TatA